MKTCPLHSTKRVSGFAAATSEQQRRVLGVGEDDVVAVGRELFEQLCGPRVEVDVGGEGALELVAERRLRLQAATVVFLGPAVVVGGADVDPVGLDGLEAAAAVARRRTVVTGRGAVAPARGRVVVIVAAGGQERPTQGQTADADRARVAGHADARCSRSADRGPFPHPCSFTVSPLAGVGRRSRAARLLSP